MLSVVSYKYKYYYNINKYIDKILKYPMKF